MKHGQKALLAVVGGVVILGLASPGMAIPEDNPYAAIFARNTFGLRSPPPPPNPELLRPKPPVPQVTLTGIATYGGKKVYLKSTPIGQKEARYFTLREGQRQDYLEVITIDDIGKSVTLNNSGDMMTLTFPTNRAGAAPAPGPGSPMPAPVVPASAPATTRPSVLPPPMPARTPRTGGEAGSGIPAPGGAGLQPLPAPSMGSSVVGGSMSVANAAEALPTAEQQQVMIELQREEYRNAGDTTHMILPPTEIGQLLQEQDEEEAAAAEEAAARAAAASSPQRSRLPMPGRAPGLPF